MKRRLTRLLPAAALSLSLTFPLSLSLTSCADDITNDEHYKTPDWLKGNAYEVLQKEGNYVTFLKGIELTGYQSIVNGKSILTVMAPDDAAFATFLAAKGVSSIEQLYQQNPDYTKRLIGTHLMYYAFDWAKMVNFRPSDGDAATEAQKNVNAGYYYKHRTHSQAPVETVKGTVDGKEQDLKIYHYETYLPVFSTKFFATKGTSDAASDYNYFYPDTKWWGSQNSGDGFNVANAMVSDKDNVITDNGYLYHVDRVVEPVNTIYDELKNNSEFSQFLSLYDSYVTYSEALNETNTSLGYTAYMRSHGSLPPIAFEWPISSTSAAAYTQTEKLEKDGYNVFAPTNDALASFFQTFWTAEQGYPTLSSLDPLIKEYFIKQMFSEDNFIVLPSEIAAGKVKTSFGTTVNFDPQSIDQKYRKICANGTLYGMNKMTAPAIFSSVVAPAFRDTTYSCYLYALDGSGLVSSLAADNSQFVALIPSNQKFYNADPAMRLYTTTSGKELQKYSTDAGAYVSVGSSAKLNMANIHISDAVTELKPQGTQVINAYAPFNYWFVKDGGICTNALFNEQLTPNYSGSPFVAFHELTNNGAAWANGRAYTYDAPSVFKTASGDGLLHHLAVCNDENYEYYLFAQLLSKAGLVQGTSISFPTDDIDASSRRLIAFVPTNETIKQNYKSIPGASALFNADGTFKPKGTVSGTNKSQLQNWLCTCFVSTEDNQFTDYPFIGSSCHGDFITKALTSNLAIKDNGSSLSIQLVGSSDVVNVISKYSYFPFAFNDGCLHFVDGIIKAP